MLQISRSLCLLFLIVSSPLFAQKVHLSNDDPRWGETITVSYTTADTSSFARPENKDTLFCAAIVQGVRPDHAIILPMRHLNGALYETKFTIPDSTFSIWLEILVPTDRVPNGIEAFTCRTRDGQPTPGAIIKVASSNIDSALDADLKEYPKHYTSYVAAYDHARQIAQSGEKVMPDSAWKPWMASLIRRLKASPDNTVSWHLALGELYMRRGKDSLANIEFQDAAKTPAFDPLFNEGDFWNHFFAPGMLPGGKGLSWPIIPGRIIAPLVEHYPQTNMAATWIRHMAFDTLLPANTFRQVSDRWATSNDVDVVLSISMAYGYSKGPLYDPKEALVWCERAERSSESFASFYSGDNIWGSMGRLPNIIAQKIYLLGKCGRFQEATALGTSAMRDSKQIRDKQDIGGALANMYFEAGRTEDAKRGYGEVLALGTGGYVSGLQEFYEKFKNGNETLPVFSSRLAKEYGGTIKLPSIPNFTYTTLDGKSGMLSELRGKVVVLDCWFISCPGCAIEKASLNKLVESYAGDTNVVFLSIALDDEAALKQYLSHAESKFQIVPNGSDLCSKLGVNGYPTHIIIGRDGKTLGFEMGGGEHEDEQMRPKIEQALGKM